MKRKHEIYALLWLVLIGPQIAVAEVEFPLQFVSFTIEDGLPNNTITSLAVEGETLWVGTESGLARLHRGQWQTFTTKDGLPHDKVLSLAVQNGLVWTGTYRGLGCYDGEQWNALTTQDGLPDNEIRSLAVQGDSLWVGTQRGLCRYRRRQPLQMFSDEDGLPYSRIDALAVQGDSLWVGTISGVAHSPGNRPFRKFSRKEGPGEAFAITTQGNTLWVGTSNGFGRFVGDEWRIARQGAFVTALVVHDDMLWTGTETELACYDGERLKIFGRENGLPSNGVTCLAVQDDVLWVGTYNGLACVNLTLSQLFTVEDGLPDGVVSALEVQGDVLWAGTSKGLGRYHQNRWQTIDNEGRLPSSVVSSLAVQGEALWVGTEGGLARHYRAEWRTYTTTDGLPDNEVTCLATQGQTLWIGTGEGLCRFSRGQPSRTFNTEDGLPDNEVTCLAIHGETLWAGTNGGLARYVEGQWRAFTTDDGLPHNRVLALAAQGEAIWVATRGWVGPVQYGFGRFDGSEWRTLNIALPDGPVQSLAVQGDSLWVGTDYAMGRYNRNHWWTLGQVTLPERVISFAVQDDSLWAGTEHGLIRFDFSKFGPVLNFVGQHDKTVEQSRTLFETSAYDPTHQTPLHLLRYGWKLEGPVQVEETTRERFFQTPELVDGAYTLQVIAIDRFGFRSKPQYHEFEVARPKAPPHWLLGLLISSGVLSCLYGISLPPLVALYSKYSWARTAVNSGVFDKFPLLHKTLLNSRWARRHIFRCAAEANLASTVAPLHYVPQSAYQSGHQSDISVDFNGDGQYFTKLFREGRRVLILGRSGTGKSVLVRHILRHAAHRFLEGHDHRLPVLIDLRTSPPLGKRIEGVALGRSVEELIHEQLSGAGIELSDDVLNFLIGKGSFLLLIDSLNEIRDDELQSLLQPFLTRDSSNDIILASQIDSLDRPDVLVYRIREFSEEQARQYLRKMCGSDVWQQLTPDAKKLATNPQDLSVLGRVVSVLPATEVPTARGVIVKCRVLRL